VYNQTTKEFAGITLVTAFGGRFTASDIWELVGRDEFLATFHFVPGTKAFHEFGASVAGVPHYSRPERTSAPQSLTDEIVRVDALMRQLVPEKRKLLKYRGIRADQIATIVFVPYRARPEFHATGEKKVPNVISIPYEHNPSYDPDNLFVSFMVMKLNDGYELIPHEREKFLGITLGRNDGRIDSRLLAHLGYDKKSAEESTNLQYYALTTKQRRASLSDLEAAVLADFKCMRSTEVVLAIGKELIASNIASRDLDDSKPAFEQIVHSAKSFTPSVLLIRKRPIFWDLAGYLHISLRHVRELQLGVFKAKSRLPYMAKDLKLVIEKVLNSIREEIDLHMDTRPASPFFRVGAMSVYFNGDYYALHIDVSGRLEAFHLVEDRPPVI
jgi:hypothetical protein